jgi:hypothetical protein
MEDSCEYIEQAVTYSRQGVVLQVGVWVRGWQPPTVRKTNWREMLHSASELDGFVEMI